MLRHALIVKWQVIRLATCLMNLIYMSKSFYFAYTGRG